MRLLGEPRLRWAGRHVRVPTRKALAMVAWLSQQRRPTPRSVLSELLWGPDRMRNVRQELYRLRQLPGAGHWLRETEGGALSLHAAVVDVDDPPVEWAGEVLEGLGGLTEAFDAFREELREVTLHRWTTARLTEAEVAIEDDPARSAGILDRILERAPDLPDALALRRAAAARLGDPVAPFRMRSVGSGRSWLADRLERLLAVLAEAPSELPPVPRDVLARAIDTDAWGLADALRELVDAGVLDAKGAFVGPAPAPGPDAPLLHARLAAVLADDAMPGLRAWHHERSGERSSAARDYLRDGRPWALRQARSLDLPPPERAEVLSAVIDQARREGDAQTVSASLGDLGELAVVSQALPVLGIDARQRAHEALRAGHLQEAQRLAGRAREYGEQGGDPGAVARARIVEAAIALRDDRTREALEGLEVARGSGLPDVELQVLNALGAAHALAGDVERAVDLHEEALGLARRVGALAVCVRVLNNLAATAERRADYARSAAAFAEVVTIGQRLGGRGMVRTALLNQAQVALIRGRLGEARASLRDLPGRGLTAPETARAWDLRGQLEHRCGRWDEAARRFRRAAEAYDALGDAAARSNVAFSQARLAIERGRTGGPMPRAARTDAEQELIRALEDLEQVGSRWLVAQARMETSLLVSEPAALRELADAIEAERHDVHGRFLADVARARARGDPPPQPPEGLEVVELPDVLALRGDVERAFALVERQSEGLLTDQRDALRSRIDGLLP